VIGINPSFSRGAFSRKESGRALYRLRAQRKPLPRSQQNVRG